MDYFNPNDYWNQADKDQYKGMTDKEKLRAGCWQMIIYIVAVSIGMIVCSFFTSCKSVEYVPVIEHHTDTLIVNKTAHDSIYVHDSTYIHEKGDTVWYERWHTKYIERETHDTIFQHRIDSIPKPYPVEKRVEVEKPLSWWQKTTMYAGDAMLLLLLGLIIYGIVKLRRTLKR